MNYCLLAALICAFTFISPTYAGKSCGCAEPNKTPKNAPNKSTKKRHVNEVHSKDEYNRKIKEMPLVVVKFYAPECYACEAMQYVFEELAEQYEGKILFVSADLDKEHPEHGLTDLNDISESLGIQSVPYIVFYKDGQVVDKKQGGYKKQAFEDIVQEFYAKAQKNQLKPIEVAPLKKRVAEAPAELEQPASKKVRPSVESHGIKEIRTIEEYNALLKSNKPAVVKIYTDWCGACKMYRTAFEAVASEFDGKVDFYTINGDNKALDAIVKKEVTQGYPTTIFIKNGSVQNNYKEVGAASEQALSKKVQQLLK